MIERRLGLVVLSLSIAVVRACHDDSSGGTGPSTTTSEQEPIRSEPLRARDAGVAQRDLQTGSDRRRERPVRDAARPRRVAQRGRSIHAGTDAGLVPVPPVDSGLVVPEDGRALAVADVDDDTRPDLVTTTDDGPLLVLRNANGPGTWVAVRLRDTGVNGSGIGGRIGFRRDGRPTRTVEIAASGSHPPPLGWFGPGDPTCGELEVRWPDGAVTERSVDGAGALIVGR